MTEGQAQTGLAARIEALESRAAITDLVHAYAHNVRLGDAAACVALFTADGAFETRMASPDGQAPPATRSRHVGRAALLRYFAEGEAAKAKPIPLVANVLIELDGETARGAATMQAAMPAAGFSIVGAYADSFRREQGVWRFSERIYTILGRLPAAQASS